MTIRFSPARHRNVLAAFFISGANELVSIDAANDNGGAWQDKTPLTEALRHFAAHGLSAAEHAYDLALGARSEGDEDGFEHWLAVCRMFDRRMAARLTSQRTAMPG